MAWPHDGLFLLNDEGTIELKIVNQAGTTLQKGDCVFLKTQESLTVGDSPRMGVDLGQGFESRWIAKGLGCVNVTSIDNGATGTISIMGAASVKVSGAVVLGDFLLFMGTGAKNVATASTFVERGFNFAIACGTNTSGVKLIRAFIMPWRF